MGLKRFHGLLNQYSFRNRPIFNITPNKLKMISFRSALALAVFILIFYIISLFIFKSSTPTSIFFNDTALALINLVVTITLFFVAWQCFKSGHRTYKAWIFLALGQLAYFLADFIYGILEIGLHQQPFPSISDVFYLAYYPLFAIGIILLPGIAQKNFKNSKLIFDLLILLGSVALAIWALLIVPIYIANRGLNLDISISLLYISLDFFLFFAILYLLINFKNFMKFPLLILPLALGIQIITDFIYTYQSIMGVYVSGNFTDLGYVTVYLLTGLAAVSMINPPKIKFKFIFSELNSLSKKFSWTIYLPLILTFLVYTLLIWSHKYEPQTYFDVFTLGVGIILGLVIFRQLIALKESKEAQLLLTEKQKIINKRETQLSMITNNMTDMITQTNSEGQYIYVSPSAKNMLRYEPQEMLGKYILDFVHPEDVKKIKSSIIHAKKTGSPNKAEYRYKNAQGDYVWVETIGTPLYDHENSIIGFVCGTRDITKNKRALKLLKESEIKYRTIFENTGTLTLLADQKGNLLMVNDEFENFTGFSKDEIEGKKNWMEFVFKDDLEKMTEYNQLRFINPINAPNSYEARLIDRYGNIKVVIVNVAVIPGQKMILASLFDISERKKTEQLVEESLKEKESLLREIHHRVKNNLQIISSLLNLQSAYIDDEKTLEIFKESQNRVKSMAMIHEKLYRSVGLSQIDFGDYMKNLAYDLLSSYRTSSNPVKLNADVENIKLDIDKAIPCGLLLNEVISNSLKHAFNNRNDGEISLDLHQKNNEIKLSVKDNGIGLPINLNLEKADTLGLRLIYTLVGQLDGNIEVIRKNGTEFKINFPIIN
jgi:two-component system, sensor histidine kinase PdtaS